MFIKNLTYILLFIATVSCYGCDGLKQDPIFKERGLGTAFILRDHMGFCYFLKWHVQDQYLVSVTPEDNCKAFYKEKGI